MSGPPTFPHKLIRASAGTGKTFQLSNRYLGLIAAGHPIDTLLATTFTRKAAGEILDRILSRLAAAAESPAAARELAQHTGVARLDADRCRTLLGDMVRQLHRIRSGTLDSFFLQIARSFSLELGLPLGWRISDEVEDAALRAEAIRNVLADEATGDVVRLMHLLTKGEASRSVSEQIAALVNELYALFVDSDEAAWHAVPRSKELSGEELAAAINALEALPLKAKSFQTARLKDLDYCQRGDWETFLAKGLAAKILAGETTYSRAPITADVATVYQPLLGHAKAAILGRIANQTEATWRLLERFDKAYQRLKIERRALRFDDVARRLSTAALDDRLDEIVYRLDAHLGHLLLDEFQDTSPIQWRVLRPFARVATDASGQRSFFCVGDVKQAIYGWRGGVAEIFEALRDELPNLQLDTLDQSFRSSPRVIEVVNRVFERLPSNAALAGQPDAAARWAQRYFSHTTARGHLPGYCCLQTAPRADGGPEQLVATLTCAAEHVVALHAACPGRTIGVLLRRNAGVARMIYELRQRGLEASEEGGNPLTDSPAVELILSLLTLADHPGDTVARFHVATSPLGAAVGIQADADSRTTAIQAAAIRRQLMERGYGPTLHQWVGHLRDSCDRRSMSRLMQLVELGYGYDPAASARVDDFVTLVRQRRVDDVTSAPVRVMTIHQSKGLQFDIVVLPELDARLVGQTPQVVVDRATPTAPVRAVCRYVSKELQGLLPAALQPMFAAERRQVAEEALSVLYVAMTRAIHALHMVIAPSKESEQRMPATFAGVVRAGLTAGNPLPPESIAFELGDPQWAATAPPAKIESQTIAAEVPTRIKLAPHPPRRARGWERISPSNLEGGVAFDVRETLKQEATALNRGTLFHAWFALVEWLDDDVPSDAELRAAAEKPEFHALDVPKLLRQFRAILKKPAVVDALSRKTYAGATAAPATQIHGRPGLAQPHWTVWRERPFAVVDGDALLSGTIDRLVVLGDGGNPVGADILDFKTDRVTARGLGDRVEFYRPQLEAYRRAAGQLTGLPEAQISARLLFVEPGVVVDC